MSRTFHVLANEHAGSTERDQVAVAVARLAERGPTTLGWTSAPEDFDRAVSEVPDDGQLVVAGGDGSIHLALECLDRHDRTDRPVGIIPLGTGNDFARNHHLPLDADEAADVVVNGRPTPVDVIELRDGDRRELIANNLHVGLGVRSADRAKPMKKSLSRLAYPVATAFEGAKGTCAPYRITVDGEVVWDEPLLAALFLLGGSMGGGVHVIDTDTRSLDVIAVGDVSGPQRLGLVRAALRSDLGGHPAARHWSAAGTVVVEAEGGVEVNADGELTEHGPRIELRHQRAGWMVLTPA
ncbi:MAG TPA: diacylglycerol kinase family protein [Acidimicrobiales bacterium]|nr:diacylglycerol kinase family protein [Acidimicrobiales bacterium]